MPREASWIRGLAFGGIFCLGACGGSDTGGATGPDPLDAIASVTVAPPSVTVDVGASTQFTATVLNGRGDVVSANVAWSSAAPAVASVTTTGLVTGVSEGVAVVTASASGRIATATVTVNDPTPTQPSNVQAVAVSNTEMDVTWTDNSDDETEFRIERETASSASSAAESGAAPAVFDLAGTVGPNVTTFHDSGLTDGTSYRYHVLGCNQSGCSDPSTASPDVSTHELLKITTSQLASGVLGLAYDESLEATGAGGNYSWTLIGGALPDGLALSESGGISGTVTALGTFSFIVQAHAAGQTAIAELEIVIFGPVSTVEVAPGSATLVSFGETVQLSAIARDVDSNVISGRIFSWSSSSEGVATVSASGLVTAVANGLATITATTDGVSGTASITVSQAGVPNALLWKTQLSENEFQDVWGSSATDMFAVGSHGILHYDGISWSPQVTGGPGGKYKDLSGVWGTSSTDVFAVGRRSGLEPERSGILHYDGTSWSKQNTGTTSRLRSVWGSSSTDVFAVGDDGTILHYDGTSWSMQNSGTTLDLRSVWGSSSTDVFAVGGGGTILHYDGTSWSPQASGTPAPLRGVWGSSSTDVFAVGFSISSGTILHYDGTSWSPQASGTTEGLMAVWGTSSSDVFAIGGDTSQSFSLGTILHYDGTSWSEQIGGATDRGVGVWGSSSTNVFVVSLEGSILHYDGSSWTTDSSWRTSSVSDIWGSSPTNVFAVGQNRIIASGPPTGGYKILHYDGTSWSAMVDATTDEVLADVWGSSSTDVFAVGGECIGPAYLGSQRCSDAWLANGFVLHYDGTSWSMQSTATAFKLSGVWGSSSTDVFAVGDGGTILHYNGTSWSAQASGTDTDLRRVWGTSSTDVFAVGKRATVLHYDGTSWSMQSTPGSISARDLADVWGSSSTDVFAVGGEILPFNRGTSSVLLHYDGTSWSKQASGMTGNPLRSVWGSSPTDVFAVGWMGTILHYDGTSWSFLASGFGDLGAVWGSSSTDLFVGGLLTTTLSECPGCPGGIILHGTR